MSHTIICVVVSLKTVLKHLPVWLCLVSLLLVLSCNGGTNIYPSNYDQSCVANHECTAIVRGDVCMCGLHCAAINQKSRLKYEKDLQSLHGCGFSISPACGDKDPIRLCKSSVPPVCLGGRCQMID